MIKAVTKEIALKKIKQFCSYQERCHKEVQEKLFSYGLYSKIANEIIAELVEENYLNEERFARQFAGGKFRIKQWGRKKIVHGLKQKGANATLIKIALKEIDEEDYYQKLIKLAAKKWENLHPEPMLSRKAKVTFYLLQKGYEPALIGEALKKINGK